MNLAPTLGWVATVLFTICYIPQIIKTHRTKKVEGLSFWLLAIQFIGNIVALWYAIIIDQPPLQVKYLLAFIFLAVCLVMYIRILVNQRKAPVVSESQ